MFGVFEMAAMPFPCYDILLIQGTLPRVKLPRVTIVHYELIMFAFLSPISIFFIGNGLALSLIIFREDIFFDHQQLVCLLKSHAVWLTRICLRCDQLSGPCFNYKDHSSPTLSKVKYFNQLLLAVRKVHAVYFDQL